MAALYALCGCATPHGGLSLLFENMTDRMTMQSRFNTLIGVQKATLDKLSEGIAVFGPDGRLKLNNAAFASIWDLDPSSLEDNPHFDTLIGKALRFYHDRDFWAEMGKPVLPIQARSRAAMWLARLSVATIAC